MGLFGAKKQERSKKKVRSTVVRTQNVAKELLNIAKSYNIDTESLDFNILSVQSYTRLNQNSVEDGWEEVETETLRELDEETNLLNPNFEIKQVYEIEVFSMGVEHENAFSNCKAAVAANATKCKVYLSIPAGAILKYTSQFEHDFEMYINKKKIRAGMLIGIFDEMVEESISKLSAKVRIHETYTFQESERHLIAEGLEPTDTVNDKLLLHYKDEDDKDEKAKVDYSSRGFIKSVHKGEAFIEYVKPKQGRNGRNCRGNIIEPPIPTVTNEPTFTIDDSIEKIDEDDSVKYVAKENGYIAFENNGYTIKQDVDVSEISFKTTGSISSGMDSDVAMSVTENDAIKDAIGSGMVVEVSELDVEGNVGSNATVMANRITVGGQTHQSSYIKANDLTIAVHKGTAAGGKIHITRLESGIVQGKEITIGQAVGGKIYGQDITLELCASHVKATATQRIEIKKLHGSENIFTIDPTINDEIQKSIEEDDENSRQLKIEVHEMTKQLQNYHRIIKDGMSAFIEIKKRLMHYKKNGVKMPASFVKKYKQFQAVQEKSKKLEEQLNKKKEHISLLNTKASTYQTDIFKARIINREAWIGYNEIRFKLVEPPMELVYKPAEGSQDKIFGVKEIDEEQYAIVPLEHE